VLSLVNSIPASLFVLFLR